MSQRVSDTFYHFSNWKVIHYTLKLYIKTYSYNACTWMGTSVYHYHVNRCCPSTRDLTFPQAAAMASIYTSTRRCSSWAVTFVAPWWTPPGAKDTRSKCATGCTCHTGTAASTPCSPSQVVAMSDERLKLSTLCNWRKFSTPPSHPHVSINISNHEHFR